MSFPNGLLTQKLVLKMDKFKLNFDFQNRYQYSIHKCQWLFLKNDFDMH